VAVGRDPTTLPADELWNDEIIEVAPDGQGGGEIVWRWSFWEHLIQDRDETKPNFGKISEHPRRMDINVGAVNPFAFGQADWMHTNSIAYNAKLDQIMISSNFQSEVYNHHRPQSHHRGGGRTGRRSSLSLGQPGELFLR
jgi:hypothetical protein